jgi:hypothetical protein
MSRSSPHGSVSVRSADQKPLARSLPHTRGAHCAPRRPPPAKLAKNFSHNQHHQSHNLIVDGAVQNLKTRLRPFLCLVHERHRSTAPTLAPVIHPRLIHTVYAALDCTDGRLSPVHTPPITDTYLFRGSSSKKKTLRINPLHRSTSQLPCAFASRTAGVKTTFQLGQESSTVGLRLRVRSGSEGTRVGRRCRHDHAGGGLGRSDEGTLWPR